MSNLEQTLSIIKPDAVERNLEAEIKEMFQDKGFKIVKDKKIQITKSEAEQFYKVHETKPFYNDLCAYLSAVTTAVVEFALLRGIDRFTCIADSGWLSQILSLGWDCRPLGLPRDIAGLNTGALVIEIDSDTPDKLRTAGTYVPMRIVHANADGRAAA